MELAGDPAVAVVRAVRGYTPAVPRKGRRSLLVGAVAAVSLLVAAHADGRSALPSKRSARPAVGVAGRTGRTRLVVPRAPQMLTASPANTQLTVTWARAPRAYRYELRYRPVGARVWRTSTGIRSTSAVIAGLTNGRAYMIAVRSQTRRGRRSPYTRPLIATPRLSWIMLGSTMAQLAAGVPAQASHFFDTPYAYADGTRTSQNQVPPGYATTPTLKYASFADFQNDVSAGAIDPTVRAVLYDPEKWDRTPLVEQLDPGTYLRMFAQLAHQHGYFVIETPARDLAAVPGARCTAGRGEGLSAAALRCGLAGQAARYADVVQVQSQVDEFDPAQYGDFVRRSVAQARAVNPAVVVMAGLSTSPPTGVATADQLVAAANAVRTDVAGFYLTVCTTCPGELAAADGMFQTLAATGW
jgi:hypothetical protein